MIESHDLMHIPIRTKAETKQDRPFDMAPFRNAQKETMPGVVRPGVQAGVLPRWERERQRQMRGIRGWLRRMGVS